MTLNYKPNLNQPEPTRFKPIPIDYYPVYIEDAEDCISKKGNSKHIKLVLKITDGEFENRKAFHYITYAHRDPDMKDLCRDGFAMIDRLCMACGIGELKGDVTPFVDKFLKAKIGTSKDKKTGEMKTNVYDYMPLDSAAGSADTQAPYTAPPGDSFDDDIPF